MGESHMKRIREEEVEQKSTEEKPRLCFGRADKKWL